MLFDMQQYIDAHCHLEKFDPRRLAGICNAVTESDWFDIASLSRNPRIYGAIGIHPLAAGFATDGWDLRMVRLLEQRPDLMIGEIGLDDRRDGMDLQQHVFATQIDIAAILCRTVHIHCIGVWGRLLEILAARKIAKPILFHSFNGSIETMKILLSKYDAYFSVSPSVLNSAHRRARMLAGAIPSDRILVESDGADWSVFMATVRMIAELRNRPVSEMARIMYTNTQRMLCNG